MSPSGTNGSKTVPGRQPGTDWLDELRTLAATGPPEQRVTVWLRSGWQVTGIPKERNRSNGQPQGTNRVFQLHGATVFKLQEGEYLPVSAANTQRIVSVSADDIDFIGVGFLEETVSQQDSKSTLSTGVTT